MNGSKSKGGHARANSLSPERRTEIARNAANKRWSKPRHRKPPIGVYPEKFWIENRIKELNKAIERYRKFYLADVPQVVKWLEQIRVLEIELEKFDGMERKPPLKSSKVLKVIFASGEYLHESYNYEVVKVEFID